MSCYLGSKAGKMPWLEKLENAMAGKMPTQRRILYDHFDHDQNDHDQNDHDRTFFLVRTRLMTSNVIKTRKKIIMDCVFS